MSTTAIEVACPKCGGRMWDNREGKRNPKAPDYKCRDRNCDGVIWPPKGGGRQAAPARQGVNIGQTGNAMLDEQDAHEAQATREIARPAAPSANPVDEYFKVFDGVMLRLKARATAGDLTIHGEPIPVDLQGVNALAASIYIQMHRR